MKKIGLPCILLTGICLLISMTTLHAQRLILKGGINHSKMHIEDDDGDYTNELDAFISGHLGGMLELKFSEMFSGEAGIMFSAKGMREKSESSYGGIVVSSRYRLMAVYAELPVNIKAGFDAGNVRIVVHGGPYMAMGLFGSFRSSTSGFGETEVDSESISWGTEEDDNLRRPDFGFQAGAGVEFSEKFYGGIQYSHGLSNIASNTEGGTELNNRVISLSFGYILDLGGGE